MAFKVIMETLNKPSRPKVLWKPGENLISKTINVATFLFYKVITLAQDSSISIKIGNHTSGLSTTNLSTRQRNEVLLKKRYRYYFNILHDVMRYHNILVYSCN